MFCLIVNRRLKTQVSTALVLDVLDEIIFNLFYELYEIYVYKSIEEPNATHSLFFEKMGAWSSRFVSNGSFWIFHNVVYLL